MDGISSNGHHPHPSLDTHHPVNAYADAVRGEHPDAIVEFELATDPYANMLPGISNIRAARAIGEGMQLGRRGNRGMMLISLGLLIVLLLPLALAVISQVVH